MTDIWINIQRAYFDGGCPYPVAFLWIGGRLFDAYPAGTSRRRVEWLPSWFPFNVVWDHGPAAQQQLVRYLKSYAARHGIGPAGIFGGEWGTQ